MVCCMALTGCNNDDDITENNNAQPDDIPKECIRPGFLQPGDKVAVVSPSYVTDDVTTLYYNNKHKNKEHGKINQGIQGICS